MPVVALDANALMMPVELDVRVFDELDRLLPGADLVTPRAVLTELSRLADGGSREARAARVGRDLARDRCRIIDSEADNGDDALVDLARSGAVDYVVTNDGPLRERLQTVGVPVVGLRGTNTLAIARP